MRSFIFQLSIFFLSSLGILCAQEASPASSPGNSTTETVTSTPSQKSEANSSNDLAGKAATEQLPQISASILRTQLQQESDSTKRSQIALRLAEILLTESNAQDALALLESKDLESTSSEETNAIVLFWKAQALLALNRAKEAQPLLENILSTDHLPTEYRDAAKIALARTDRALGTPEKALTSLDSIPSTSRLASLALQEKATALLTLKKNEEVENLLKKLSSEELREQPRFAYLLALAAWQQGNKMEALQRFHKITTTDPWISAATISGVVQCDIDLNKPAEAQILLEKYLEENPRSPRLPELMAQLEQLYITQNNNDFNLFRKWSKDKTEPFRASYALIPYSHMMRRLEHIDKADTLLSSFLYTYPNHPLQAEASLELAESKLLQNDASTALSYVKDKTDLPPAMRARFAFERGLAESILKHPELAETAFAQAASFDSRLSSEALNNQALLQLIKTNDNNSISSSQKITTDNLSTPQEHEEYLAVLNADQGTRQSALAVIKAARRFLKAYPKSSFANQIRMKLGEALLVYGNVREARVELETVGKLENSSALGRQAFLLAAQAASRSMDSKSLDDALMLLEQVAQSNNAGADAWQARLEQASLKNAQALPLEAIAIYDQILASPEPSLQIRRTAQMAKGDTLSALGLRDSSNYQAAIAIWRSLADTPEVPSYWRNEALCKIGLMSEKMGDNDAALAAYYEAMKTPLSQEPEPLWHDKAAFEAARLLEARKQWNEAIRLYQQIVLEGGPRAAEAQARVSKLRLENFLWDK